MSERYTKHIAELGSPIAYYSLIAKTLGGMGPGLFICQLIYWTPKSKNDGWIYKTQQGWFDELGMSRCEQETTRKRLKKLGVLLERRSGIPAKLWFKVDEKVLDSLITEYKRLSPQNRLKSAKTLVKPQDAEIQHPCTRNPCIQDGSNPAYSDAGFPQTITETTTETTLENRSRVSDADKSSYLGSGPGPGSGSRDFCRKPGPEPEPEPELKKETRKAIRETEFAVLEKLNRVATLRYILGNPAVSKKHDTDLKTALEDNGFLNPRFMLAPSFRRGVRLISEALSARGLTPTADMIATVIVQAHLDQEEGGKGHRIIDYLIRGRCGLTLIPFALFVDSNGVSLTDEVIDGMDIEATAAFMTYELFNPVPKAELARRQEIIAEADNIMKTHKTESLLDHARWLQLGRALYPG